MDAAGEPLVTAAARTIRLVVVCSPKGGTGKSSLSRNLLVSASQARIPALGIDFDPQESLGKWAKRRARTREGYPDFVAVECIPGKLSSWSGALRQAAGRRLVIADTPPAIEHDPAHITALCEAAHLVLVPTSATSDDLDSVMPWMEHLQHAGCRAAFVMNRVNRQTRTFTTARNRLVKVAALCPVEIPVLEDMHSNAPVGLSLLDIARSRGIEPMEGLWAYVQREAGL